MTGTDSAAVAVAAPLPEEIPGENPVEIPEETSAARIPPRPALAVSNDRGNSSSAPAETKTNEAKADVRDHPLVKTVLKTFPGSTIDEVREDVAPDPESGESDGKANGEAGGG